ncbi:MAG: translation elongation factor-like protein [Thermodesulfobacteriota bacterium]|nr:translation elongation factor-like protein [Thermodesulfobacteriota bacterium]
MAEEKEVGVVIKFFAKPGVAAIEVVAEGFKTGDRLAYRGQTTDFEDVVQQIEIDNQPVDQAKEGKMVGVKVPERVRPNDKVFKILD